MAGNSKDSKILAYKDMINQLNKTISTQTELIQSLQKTLETDRLEKENFRQQIEYLTKKLFGTSSEKRKDIDGRLNLLMKPGRKQIRHGNRNFLMTSLFRNIREKQDGHMLISLKMFLPATRSFLFRRRSETVQPAERGWNVLGKNSSAMNFVYPCQGKSSKYLS